jgi:lipopolysaccharide exporter
MVQSISWSLAGNWLIRGIGVLKMILLARILSPHDFGVIGAALLAINCLGVFSDVGISAALIQKKQVDRDDLDTAWTMTIARGILLFGFLFAAAGPLADYFAQPDLKTVFRVIAGCFVLEGFTNIGILFFQRDIDFKHKAKLDVISDLAGSISAVLLALILKDFWALVWANVIWRLIYFGLSFRLHPYRPRLCWERKRAAHLIHFGKHMFWISVVTFVVTNGDDALVGRLLGLDLLGYYTMAYAIANLPVTSLCETIGRISLPVYAQIQDDRQRVKEAFQKVFESVLMILLPSTALIMMLAEDFIAVFLGDRWLPMAGVLRVLCLLGLFRGLSNVIAPVHLAVNRPEIQSRNKTVELMVFALLIYPLTTLWGLIGAGWAVSAVYLVGLIMNVEALSRLLKDVPQIIYTALRCPLASTAGMILSALLAGTVFSGWDPLLRFFLSGFAAVAVFFLIAVWINHGVIMDVYRRMIPKKCGNITT